jgi:LPS-assembly lipoprotein
MNRTVGRRGLCFGSLALLGGCGFQPVYMPTASGKPGVAQRGLASVYVGIIPERPGQLLRQALQEHLGDDAGRPTVYDLSVTFAILGEGIAINQNDIATRVRLTGNATWTLRRKNDLKRIALAAGTARTIDGVNIFGAQYFAADLEIEARQKSIAENIASQISTQLAVWFRQQAASQNG